MAVSVCTYALPTKELPSGLVLLQVTPAGEFLPSDGRAMDSPPWNIDGSIAQRVIERFEQRKQPAVIDYEHQTLLKEQNGQPAPAAAWMRSLRWLEGQGLFAVAELTEQARQQIAAKQYLYFSPVFEYSRDTGEVLAVHMGAFTNNPAIHGMAPMSLMAAASAAFISPPVPPLAHPPEITTVNPLLKALLAHLGLPETTTEPAAIAALTAAGSLATVKAQSQALDAAVRQALGLHSDATGDAVIAACSSIRTSAQNPDPAKFVPVSVVDELRSSVVALTSQVNARAIDDLVKPALADGRLLPAQETWARELGKTNVAALSGYLQTAQPIAALTSTQTQGKPPVQQDGALAADALAVCSAMGLTPEQFKAGAVAANA